MEPIITTIAICLEPVAVSGHFIIDCGCGLGGMEGVHPATEAEALAREHAQRHADQTRDVLRAYYSDPDYHETPILADREETTR